MYKNLTVGLSILLILTTSAFSQDRSIVNSYQTSTAPTIDGVIEPGEWDAAGQWIEVRTDSPGARFGEDIDEDVFGGDSDLSFRFKTMWMGDWFIYFAYEVTDDIAMDSDPRNLWERDQIEHFMDGNDLAGNDDPVSFHWWDNDEPYGKFGLSRQNTFEGNGGAMSLDIADLLNFTDESTFIACVAVGQETGVAANWTAEYVINIEPLWFLAVIDDPIAEGFTMKYTVALSDDDNFDTGDTERSSALSYWRSFSDGTDDDPGWDVSSGYATLTLTSEFTGDPSKVQQWSLY